MGILLEVLWSPLVDGITIVKMPPIALTPRVQVPNNHILAQNLY